MRERSTGWTESRREIEVERKRVEEEMEEEEEEEEGGLDGERNSIPRYFLLLVGAWVDYILETSQTFQLLPPLPLFLPVHRSKRPNHGSRTLESTDPAMRQRRHISPTTPPSLSRAILVAPEREASVLFLCLVR